MAFRCSGDDKWIRSTFGKNYVDEINNLKTGEAVVFVKISEQNQKSMIKGKIDLAYFYCCSYLLKSKGLCSSICSGNKILEEEFTSTAGVFNG